MNSPDFFLRGETYVLCPYVYLQYFRNCWLPLERGGAWVGRRLLPAQHPPVHLYRVRVTSKKDRIRYSSCWMMFFEV